MGLANRVTIVRMLLVPVCMALLYMDFPGNAYVAAALFALTALTDMLDGRLARKYNDISAFGKLMDPIADKMLVFGVLLVLVEQGRVPAWVTYVFLAREFLVSGLRMVRAGDGKVIAASWLAKVKTATQDAAIVLVILNNWPFSLIGLPMADIWLYAAIVLSIVSAGEYFIRNR